MSTTRDDLGRLVREEWVRYAQQQPNSKPQHLVGWGDLDADNKEVDCRIGLALYQRGVEESDEQRACAALRLLGFEPDAFEGHLDKCSPVALRRIIELLAPDTGDERNEMLSVYARERVSLRLRMLSPRSVGPRDRAL